MNIRRIFGLCAFVLATTSVLAAPEAGKMMRMQVTATMQMAGMPFNLPATTHTQNVCTSTRKPDPRELMKQHEECKLTNYQEVGDTISYRMQCSSGTQMTGEGSLQTLPNGDVRGKVHLTSNTDGQAMALDMTYVGERTGSCDYQPPAA